MQINISGKNIKLTKAIKDYVYEKVNKLGKYLSNFNPVRINIELHSSGRGKGQPRSTVECTITVPDAVFRCEETASDLYEAIDIAQEKMEKKLRQLKEKFLEKKQRVDKTSIASFGHINTKDLKRLIKKRKKFDLGNPIDETEAIARMELLGHDFYIYLDKRTGGQKVVYRRADGGYGVIEGK